MKAEFLIYNDDDSKFPVPQKMCPYNGKIDTSIKVKVAGPYCENHCKYFKGLDMKKQEVTCLKERAEKNVNLILNNDKKI